MDRLRGPDQRPNTKALLTGAIRSFSLIYCLVMAWGCAHVQNQGPDQATPQVAAKTQKEIDLPKRTPQASTCVAFGSFNAELASKPGLPLAQQEQMREQARRAYQQALKIDPNSLAAYAGLGKLYQEKGDYEQAAAVYQKSLKEHPKEAPVWFELGMCQARQKNWDQALESLKKATELDEGNTSYTNALGFCLARAGRYEESYAFFQKAVGPAQAHYNVARMLHHVNQDESSKEHLRLALQLNPDLTGARQLQAELEGSLTGTKAAAAISFEGIEDAVRELGNSPGSTPPGQMGSAN
jgi:tetratricopeptide (TPR) repeat protein